MPSPARRRCPRRSCAGRRCCPATSGALRWSRSPRVPLDCTASGSRWGAASSRCSRSARRTSPPRWPTSDRRRSSGSSMARASRCTVSTTTYGSITRNLNDVTGRLPGVVDWARALPVRAVVLDGEAIGVDDDARPHAFQDTMSSFGRDRDPVAGRRGGARRILLRCAAPRRRRSHRSAARRATRARACARGGAACPELGDRVGRRGHRVPRGRARRGARGRDGEGTRLDATTPVVAVARGAR